mmetsp:Transcript_23343/g.59744  ORF Transcript_23343/g.59744 Transcript_23343/m.59744 type:complete len:386 (-) Transcript_23343:414-1571(-)
MKVGLAKLLAGVFVGSVGFSALIWARRNKKPKGYYDSLPWITLRNNVGMEVTISAVGAAITKCLVPDANGNKKDIVLGYSHPEDYVTKEPVTYFGVVVGRVANRIANAKFSLDGESYALLANNGPNALHGGALGLHKRTWEARRTDGTDYQAVTLTYDSPNGEEGYPGDLHVVVTYRLAKDKNELTCSIRAINDVPTPVNIAQHSYFNLAGHDSGRDVLDHVVHIPSGDHYTPVNANLIPTGEVLPVKATPFDFTLPRAIGERIAQVPGGYDHNYVLFNMGGQAKFIVKKGVASDKPKLAATVRDPKSGRCMDILTTAPGMQFYTGNFLDTSVRGKGGVTYFKHAGFCMETQGFPDSINQPNFPSIVMQPEDTYRHDVVYRFYNK